MFHVGETGAGRHTYLFPFIVYLIFFCFFFCFLLKNNILKFTHVQEIRLENTDTLFKGLLNTQSLLPASFTDLSSNL